MLLSAVLIWKNASWNYHPLVLCFASSLVGGYAITHSTERSYNDIKDISDQIALHSQRHYLAKKQAASS